MTKPRMRYEQLTPHQIRNILLVASRYDSFTFQDQGGITDQLFDQTELMNPALPHIERVSSPEEALQRLKRDSFDMVITLLRISGANVFPFVQSIKALRPDIPVLLLATSAAELSSIDARVDHLARLKPIQGSSAPQEWDANPNGVWTWPFIWQGDVRLFTAMIKCVEDRLNILNDVTIEPEIRVILLVEDNVKFYSSYLPMLYTELVKQQQAIMADTLTPLERLRRRRARPKILLANTFEEGMAIYRRFKENMLCVILDMSFPRDGRHSETAGLEFGRVVRAENSNLPIVIQSQVPENAEVARSIDAHFIHKLSSSLLHDFRAFLVDQLGFGPFHFRLPNNGKILATANDLRSFTEILEMEEFSDVSLIYHTSKNQFSLWLAARGEFELAALMRSKKLSEFASTKHMRQYVVEQIHQRRTELGKGEVTVFSQSTFNPSPHLFSRIGGGSLGGKGRGLGFINSVITQLDLEHRFPDIKICVPPTLVLTTDIFDQFMEESNLVSIALNRAASDSMILDAFMKHGKFTESVVSDLRVFLGRVRHPLVVRSSSLFEDTFRQPFAGVYRTHVLSNTGDLEMRLKELLDAIRSVYASTFSQEANAYVESTSYRTEEMKMAVLIQEMAGRTHEHYHYPDAAGVARAFNFYPSAGEVAEDGVALAVLGLGSSVVDGGIYARFSPGANAPHITEGKRYPNVKATTFQRSFLALDLTKPCFAEGRHNQNIVELGLDAASRHGTLASVGSAFDPATSSFIHFAFSTSRGSQAAGDPAQKAAATPKINYGLLDFNVHGLRQSTLSSELRKTGSLPAASQPKEALSPPGRHYPVVTLTNLLTDPSVALKEVLRTLLKIGTEGFASPVEIEWALSLSDNPKVPHRFFVLQIRPMSNWSSDIRLGVDFLPSPSVTICGCKKALGNGLLENIKDIVFVPSYDPKASSEIVEELARLNGILVAEKRPYILIAPGRFGKEKSRGIPVSWQAISGVSCLVETEMEGIDSTPSEGTHFFQNITSFGIGYLSIPTRDMGSVDYAWLQGLWKKQNPHASPDEWVKRVTFEKNLEVAIDGLSGCGVVMKPEHDLNTVLQANAFLALESNPVLSKL